MFPLFLCTFQMELAILANRMDYWQANHANHVADYYYTKYAAAGLIGPPNYDYEKLEQMIKEAGRALESIPKLTPQVTDPQENDHLLRDLIAKLK